MIKRLRLVVVDRADGPVSVAYIGGDAQAAEVVYLKESQNPGNEMVRLLFDPPAIRSRWPSTELVQARVNDASRRVGLATELEAATSAARQAKEKSDATATLLSDARKAHAKANSPESKSAGSTLVHGHAKRAEEKLEAYKQAARRVFLAQSALDAFDGKASPEIISPEPLVDAGTELLPPLTPAPESLDAAPALAPNGSRAEADEAPRSAKSKKSKA